MLSITIPVRSQLQLQLLLLFLYLSYVNCDRTVWHAYDLKKEYPSMCYDNVTNELLPKYQRSYWQNKVMSQETMEKHKLWPDVISKFDFMHGETMYGLEEALDVIYKHQHPVDCKNSKFLISGMFESGFGSEQHVIGVGLAAAMNLNRVYIMYPERKYESGTACCCHYCACFWSIHIHTHIYIYTYIHAYTHTNILTYIYSYKCVHTYIRSDD